MKWISDNHGNFNTDLKNEDLIRGTVYVASGSYYYIIYIYGTKVSENYLFKTAREAQLGAETDLLKIHIQLSRMFKEE